MSDVDLMHYLKHYHCFDRFPVHRTRVSSFERFLSDEFLIDKAKNEDGERTTI